MRGSVVFFMVLLLVAKSVSAEDAYELVALEPAGGAIKIPKDWIIEQRHQKHYMLWVIAEDIFEDNSYDVGVAIQMYVNLSQLTGKTPEAFISDFVAKYSAENTLLSSCNKRSFGDFTRTCVESIEPAAKSGRAEDHRVLYSLFWSNKMDIAVVTVAGAPVDRWDSNADHFNTMSEFTLLEEKRFRK